MVTFKSPLKHVQRVVDDTGTGCQGSVGLSPLEAMDGVLGILSCWEVC